MRKLLLVILDDTILKVNTVVLTLSLMQIEMIMKMILLTTSIAFTVVRLIKELKKDKKD